MTAPRYGVVLFDLDGTLTDPGRGIAASVRFALERLGEPVPDPARLRAFVGPPLLESFRRLCGLDESRARQALAAYREYFAERGLYENEVYPGIPALLSGLAARGGCCVVATSKPTAYAERILEHFGLRGPFHAVVGTRLEDPHATKADVVREALTRLPNGLGQRAALVGDREHDVRGARANGIDSIAVGYGYGSPEEVRAAGPTFQVDTVPELASLLLDGKIRVDA